MAELKKIIVALAGNPNAGKSSLFNQLTGLRAHVGNYPGVTVEKKWGAVEHKGYQIEFVDLPGTYSLTAFSLEEVVSRDFILNEHPDMVVNVLDSSNFERNMYLTVQFLEIGIPTVLALNMLDVCKEQGIDVNSELLSELVGVKAAPIVAKTGVGVPELLDKIVEQFEEKKSWQPIDINYGNDIDKERNDLTAEFEKNSLSTSYMPAPWLAIKYLENDEQICKMVEEKIPSQIVELDKRKAKLIDHLKSTVDNEIEGIITDQRYAYISALSKKVVKRKKSSDRTLTDKIDSIVLNRLLAPFIFLLVMFGLYEFTFWVSKPIVDIFKDFFDWLALFATNSMADGPLKSLLVDGLIAGVGAVTSFVPLIAFMFLGISLLEDTGYMARVAFILDRVFRMFGLHGNSVVALIVGGGISGGCAIPGVMAARTLRDPKERIATILVTPFMTCGAKLPVFAMLVAAFFSEHQGLVMFLISLVAWSLALIAARILRSTLLTGKPTPFVMELPQYRLPTLNGLLLHSWERTWEYLKRAGTLILLVSILIWAMLFYPALDKEQAQVFDSKISQIEMQMKALEPNSEEAKKFEAEIVQVEADKAAAKLKNSYGGRMGVALESITAPIGFDWRTNIALVGGFAAKEVILSTLATAYSLALPDIPENEQQQNLDGSAPAQLSDEDKEEQTQEAVSALLAKDKSWSPLVAVSLMFFVLLYAPCFATVVVIRKEAGNGWAIFSVVGNTLLAYILSLMVYQGGKIFGFM